MTQQEKTETLSRMEKAWFRSKKFIAFILTVVCLCGLGLAALKWQPGLDWPLAGFMIAIVICITFTALAFNVTQAKLDTFVRVAALVGKGPADYTKKLKEVLPAKEDDDTQS